MKKGFNMNISKFAKVLVLGASVSFGAVSGASAAGGAWGMADCCESMYQTALRGCLMAGNSYSYCKTYYTIDKNECLQGTGVFAATCSV